MVEWHLSSSAVDLADPAATRNDTSSTMSCLLAKALLWVMRGGRHGNVSEQVKSKHDECGSYYQVGSSAKRDEEPNEF